MCWLQQGGVAKISHRSKARAAIQSQLHAFAASLKEAVDDVEDLCETEYSDNDVENDLMEDSDSTEYGDDEIESTSQSGIRTMLSLVSSPTPLVRFQSLRCLIYVCFLQFCRLLSQLSSRSSYESVDIGSYLVCTVLILAVGSRSGRL
jgi:hypothetical protein